jgi:hypothetical protein
VEVFHHRKLLLGVDHHLSVKDLWAWIEMKLHWPGQNFFLCKGKTALSFDSVRTTGLSPGSYILIDPFSYDDEPEQLLNMAPATAADETRSATPESGLTPAAAAAQTTAAAAAAPPVAVAVAASSSSPSAAAVESESRVEVFYNRALFLRGAVGQPLPLAVLRAVIQGRGGRNPAAFHLIHRDTVTHVPFDSVAHSGLPIGLYILYPPVNDDGEPEQLLNMAAAEDESIAIPEPEVSAPAAAPAAAAAAAGTPAVVVAGVKRKPSASAEGSAPSKQQRTPSSYRAYARSGLSASELFFQTISVPYPPAHVRHPRTSGDRDARRAWQQRYFSSADTRQMWNTLLNGGPVEYLVRRPT